MSDFLSKKLLVLERWLLPGVAVRRRAKRLQPCLIQGDDAVRAGDLAAGRALYEERLTAARTSGGDDWTVSVLLLALGNVASRQHDEDQALACFEESLSLFRAAGSKRGVANALSGLGALAFRSTDLARAQALIGGSRVSVARTRRHGKQGTCAVPARPHRVPPRRRYPPNLYA